MHIHRIPYTFLLLVAYLTATGLAAQAPYQITGKSMAELRQETPVPYRLLKQSFMPLSYPLFSFRGQRTEVLALERSTAMVRAFSPNDLAFFCRLEFKLEKTVRFPVKIRLGEVQYVDQLEGK